MSEPATEYRRLPGRGLRSGGIIAAARCTAWLGPDHLLSLDRIWVNEEYKRFYFRDIQAITLRQTHRASGLNWTFGTLFVVTALIFGALAANASTTGGRTGWIVTGGIIAGVWFICWIANFLRGPTCVCKVRTAVQTEELPSLNRVRTALRAIAILKPVIENSQGALAPGELENAPPVPERSMPQAGLPIGGVGARVSTAPAGEETCSRSHAVLFALLLVDATAGFYKHLHPAWSTKSYLPIGTVLLLAVTALALTALVRQRQVATPGPLRSLTGWAFATNLMILFGAFMYGFMSRLTYTMNHNGRLPTSLNLYGMGGFFTLSLIADFVEFGLGVAGLALALPYLLGRRQPPAQVAP